MATFLITLTVELDDSEIPVDPDGTRPSADEAAARVLMMGPVSLVDVPEFLRHKMVVAAEARELHPSFEELHRRIESLEQRLAALEG